MKQIFKYTLTIATLLLVTLGAAAQTPTAKIIYKLDGVVQGESSVPGNVAVNFSTRTITVTPGSGNYLTADDLKAVKIVDGSLATTRNGEPGINTPVTLTAKDANAGPSKTTEYTFADLGDNNYGLEVTANFHPRTSISDATVTTNSEPPYVYLGTPIMPEVTVVLGSTTLTKDVDYKVYYQDVTSGTAVLDSINAGSKQIWVDGIGKYIDRATKDYTINKAYPTLTFASESATYTFGQSFTKPVLTTNPEGLTVTYASSNQDVAAVDQTTGDITAKVASEAPITITASFAGNNNYNAKDATYSLTVAKGTAVVTVAPVAKDNLTYTGGDQELVNEGTATNGTMMYRIGTEGDFSADIPKGNAAGQYTIYYMAKAINSDQFNDSEANSITATIKAKSIANATITLSAESFVYNGQNQKPEVSVKDGETDLVLGQDYTLTTEGGTDAGDYTVTVTGKGNYDSETTASKNYSIKASDMEVTAEGFEGTYDKAVHGIKVNAPEGATIKYGTSEGTYALDNSPTYTNVGEYTVYYLVTYKNYNDVTGSAKVTINPKSIADATITLTPENFVYNGQNQKPEVSVKDGETDLVLDQDYTLTNEGGTDVGEYTVTVTGKGNYDSETSVSKKYYITVEALEVTAEGFEGTYDKAAHGIKVNAPEGATIKYGTSEGTYALDNSPTYTNVGEYTVYYRVSKVNAADVTGSAKVKITPAAATISFKEATVEKKPEDATFTNELTNTGDGAVTYQTSNAEVASVNENTGEVTIKGSGEATITATVADGMNYTYETKTATYTITVKSSKKDSELSWTDPYMGYVMGTFWWGPRLNNPNNLEVKYESSDEDIATIDEEGVVTAVGPGECYIRAIFEGNDEYEAKTVSYLLEITKEYKLWVGTTQVTSENAQDILGDGHFFYDEENDWLIVTDNDTPQVIESRMNDLFLYANGSSRLERVWFNNADNSEATGRLTIISYMNIPGSLYLATSHPDGVISGFSSLNLDDESFMYLLDPMDGVYNGKLMTKEGDVAQAATISQYLRPLVNGHTVVFPAGEYSGADLRNVVMHDILNTMVQHQGDSDEDDDYYDPAESAIVINNVNTTSGMSLLLFNVEKGDLIPGSDEYAVQFRGGLTFMVPEGEGKITLDLKTEPRFRLMLMVGPTEPYEIEKTERGEVTFDYNVQKPTYCCLYLAEKEEGGNGGTRIGKRDKHHGTIYSVKISPVKKSTSNPLNGISGFPDSQTPEVELTGTDDPTGIVEIKAETEAFASPDGDNTWYDLQGRRIEEPTKAGFYIINKRKVVIK